MKNLVLRKYKVILTELAIDDLRKIEKLKAKRILDKITFYCNQKNPLSFAKKLTNPKFGSYRFRIGSFRAVFDLKTETELIIVIILTVKHRKAIY